VNPVPTIGKSLEPGQLSGQTRDQGFAESDRCDGIVLAGKHQDWAADPVQNRPEIHSGKLTAVTTEVRGDCLVHDRY